MVVASSFYWYDYETFGIHPGLDRPSQFAGIRTNMNLELIGKPLMIFNRLSPDYLPDPKACLVTGITPQEVQEKGLPEPEFIHLIINELREPGTCNIGYNNIRFDDEFTRFTLFRNFHDPYEHEWKHGNSRWDMLDVVRLTRALRPDGIEWPFHKDNKPSNRLEDLTAANDLSHEHAHDALSDVYATIEIARLIKNKQPKLFDYAFAHKDKMSIAEMLNLRLQNAVVHVSGMIPGEYGHTAIVAPIGRHPVNNNGIVVYDLRFDPSELADLTEEDIKRRIFTPQALLPSGESRLPVKTVHINKAPVLVPLSTLDTTSADRLKIDKNKSLAHLKILKKMESLPDKISAALSGHNFKPVGDLDASLYSGGFFSNDDKKRFERIRGSDAQTLTKLRDCFDDNRGDELLFRYRARHYPESLDADEKAQWLQHCRDLLLDTGEAKGNDGKSRLDDYLEKLNGDWPAAKTSLREALLDYGRTIDHWLKNGGS